ncbi:unnamed protein product, partial [Didymodactylos carnosus]
LPAQRITTQITQYSIRFVANKPLILLYTHNFSIKTRDNICKGKKGSHLVNFDYCPYKCDFSCQLKDFNRSTVVLFFGEDFSWPFQLTNNNRTSANQIWVFWSWEAPIQHPEYTKSGLSFNWTMTYRRDSDIWHTYGKYIHRNLSRSINDAQCVDFYNSPNNQSTFNIPNEFLKRKNRILWIVSNCNAKTYRNQIALKLGRYYPIDQYGSCTNKTRLSEEQFGKILFGYKFYLAFENSHCLDYITEKVFYNALVHGSIPIVMGASETNYVELLPKSSFMYITHSSNFTAFASELVRIGSDIDRYRTYHEWRAEYRVLTWPNGYYLDDKFCDLCTKLQQKTYQPKAYTNFSNWLNKCWKPLS